MDTLTKSSFRCPWAPEVFGLVECKKCNRQAVPSPSPSLLSPLLLFSSTFQGRTTSSDKLPSPLMHLYVDHFLHNNIEEELINCQSVSIVGKEEGRFNQKLVS